MTLALVSLLGAAGAVCRFVLDGAIRTWRSTTIPWATIVINVSGSFVLGVVTGLAAHGWMSGTGRVALGTGFCGGYTTFSTASFETVRLWERGARSPALVSAVGTLAATLLAAAAGLAVTGG